MIDEMIDNKYILYCAQECTFQTRSMLIPYDKFMLTEKKIKYENLKDNSYFDDSLNGFVYVDTIIGGEQSLTEQTHFINEMIDICEWGSERCILGDIVSPMFYRL